MIFNIKNWLNELGLGNYIPIFEEEAIDENTLPDLTIDDLKELGITRLGHRKKLLAAIKILKVSTEHDTSTPNKAVTSLSEFLHSLPLVVALPVHEYAHESHPVVRLWAICDTIELLLRFLLTVMISDRLQHGELDDKILRELWGKIEMPTLGAWLAMTRTMANQKPVGTMLLPESNKYILGSVSTLLYGEKNPGTPETSLLALRNRLAHGGGMTRKEAEKLLHIWKTPFEHILEEAPWLLELQLVAQNDKGQLCQMKGTQESSFDSANNELFKTISQTPQTNGIWLVRNQQVLQLWPMTIYDRPVIPFSERTGEQNVVQVYSRMDVVQLQYAPLGADGFSHSVKGGDTLVAFQRLFKLDKSQRQLQKKQFKVPGFTKELQRDANQMVGRTAEIQQVKAVLIQNTNQVLWLSGLPGIGKSFLIARLVFDLMDSNEDTHTLVLPYRFKAGDDSRCNREAFTNYVIERIQLKKALNKGFDANSEGKPEKRLKNCLNHLSPDWTLIIVIDGIDELLDRDKEFASDFPLQLRYPHITWLCAGRPEPALDKAFKIAQATIPFPDGLPPMSTQDIRSMLMEKIGPLRKKLLRYDLEQGNEVVNPFIKKVAQRADGLPLYVKYVVGDVLSGRYRVLDGDEDLPETLHLYHEELLRRLGIGDLQSILTPMVATLAVAHEPLAAHELVTFLTLRNLLPTDETVGLKLINHALAAIASMLRVMPDPEGEEGYTLFHKSLREHILTSISMRVNVELAQQAFAQAAELPNKYSNVANYLYRCGIDHLLAIEKKELACQQLLDLDHLRILFELNKDKLDILIYWRLIGEKNPGSLYVTAVESYIAGHKNKDVLKTLRIVSNLCKSSGWYQSGVSIAKISYESHKILLKPDHPDTLTSLSFLASILNMKGDYANAELLSRQALEVRERILGQEHSDTLSSLNNLANILSNKGDYKAAEPLYRQALEVCEKIFGSENTDIATILSNLSSILDSKGDSTAAEQMSRQALGIRKKILGLEHTDTLSSFNNLASILFNKEDYAAAEPLFRQTLDVQERLLGQEHPDTLTSLNNLASTLNRKGDYSKAEPLLRQVLKTRERTLGLEHPKTLQSLANLAFLLKCNNDFLAAEAMYRQVQEVRERTLGLEHPDTLTSINNLALLLQDKGDFAAAEILYRQVLEVRERILGAEHPKTLTSLNNLALLLQDKGDYSAAESLNRQTLEIYERSIGAEHPATLASKQNLAVLLRKTNRPELGVPLLREVLEVRRIQENKFHLGSVLTALGTNLSAAGEINESIQYLQESADIRRTQFKEGAPIKPLILTLNRLIDSLEQVGNSNESERIKKEVLTLTEKH